jgi:predicted metal-dependent HD superfamily phosphohydrolase
MPYSSPYNHQIICDLDLMGLGASWDIYSLNGAGVRYEYKTAISEEEFRKGREKWLTFFLKRDRIYSTDLFYDRYEKNARNNLERELAQITQ